MDDSLPQDAFTIKQMLESMVRDVHLIEWTFLREHERSSEDIYSGTMCSCVYLFFILFRDSHDPFLCTMQDVEEYDPRVVEQLMDFMYRYSAEVLQDAEVSHHSTLRKHECILLLIL